MKRTAIALFAGLAIGVATAQTPSGPATTSAGGADSTNSKTAPGFQSWMSDYQRTNKGYISREAYMNEMGRRWDGMDRNRQGLTMDQINSMYGNSQPTPGRTHAQTNATNPSGTEPKGQNSGK
ncbi:MAG: hypothetical protein M3Z31_16385 [Pseudomonadota bacterium]|nr:hypothetical protein [Pseudomonadota bacterium]